jgi:probable HAF family extracellular repeat protein
MRIRSGFLLPLLLGVLPALQADILYSVTDLGTLGGPYTEGFGLNNTGQVTGHSSTSDGAQHAFLYSNGQMTDLGTLGDSNSYSFGVSINNAGQVTGYADTPTGPWHAFLYSNGQMRDLWFF